ncbi:MAG: single-stranded DNA-binding protein [Kangiellaceae bacterium]|jgi:hypothetical protein|nr:single-stranded DNA-binding protein [Kangiellaceae bacterium]
MKIEIVDQNVDTFTTKSNNTLHKQSGYLHNGDKYPIPINFLVKTPQDAYAPGMYGLNEKSFYVNKYGQLTLGSLVLVPSK